MEDYRRPRPLSPTLNSEAYPDNALADFLASFLSLSHFRIRILPNASRAATRL